MVDSGNDDDPLAPSDISAYTHDIMQGQLSGSVQGHIALNGAQSHAESIEQKRERKRDDVLLLEAARYSDEAIVQAIMVHMQDMMAILETKIMVNDERIEVLIVQEDALGEVVEDLSAGETDMVAGLDEDGQLVYEEVPVNEDGQPIVETEMVVEMDASGRVSVDTVEVLTNEDAEEAVADFEEETGIQVDRRNCDHVDAVMVSVQEERVMMTRTNDELRAQLESLEGVLNNPDMLGEYAANLTQNERERIVNGDFDGLGIRGLDDLKASIEAQAGDPDLGVRVEEPSLDNIHMHNGMPCP